MDLTFITTFSPLITAAGYTLVLIVLLVRQEKQEQQTRWFLGFLASSTIWHLFLFFFLANELFPNAYIYLLLSGTLLLGITTSFYVDWPRHRLWLIWGAVATVIVVVVDVLFPAPITALAPEIPLRPTMGGFTALLAWLGLSGSLLVRSWRNYQQTSFPWHANRLLHWIVFAFVTFAGEGFFFINLPWSMVAGQLLRFVGVIGLARAVSSHRLFDVRTWLSRSVSDLFVLFMSVIPAGLLLLALQYVNRYIEPGSLYIPFFLVTALAFMLYQPYRRLINRLVSRVMLGSEFQTGKVVRGYSQTISRTLDVEQLSLVIIGTISELLEISRGSLMLVSQQDKGHEIEPVPAMGVIARTKVFFRPGSRLIEILATQHQPLLQYEIDFNPDYTNLPDEERAWLTQQEMELYVPVHTGTDLTGLIALGPKNSGLAYRPNELELVQILADQTVVALKNARLYSELNHQNDRIRLLNTDLRQQNQRLETLDKIKSDFITIASHELRTPLTQVKGYADILTAMNEESHLTREQTREIVGHINRASLRLEKLISAMLDASQLEVSGMELSFIPAKVETIIQLAIDPIAEAIRGRQIKLHLRGLPDLPPLQADFKRLVQAMHNLIGNAVKYTPDYGTITLSAWLIPSNDDITDYVEMVVADTGIGIDAEYHELIFEKFFRIGDPELHSSGTTKFKGAGPGLGLHIVKGVIEAHGGRVWVESEGEDEQRLPGSRFHVVVPVDAPAVLSLSQDPSAAPRRQPNRRIDLLR